MLFRSNESDQRADETEANERHDPTEIEIANVTNGCEGMRAGTGRLVPGSDPA